MLLKPKYKSAPTKLNKLVGRKAYQVLMACWISGNLHLRNSLNPWLPEHGFPKNPLLAMLTEGNIGEDGLFVWLRSAGFLSRA